VVKRSSTVLLVAGAAGLFVTLGVLVRAVHSGAPEAEPTVSTRTPSQPNAPAPTVTSSGSIASRDPVKRKPFWKTPMINAERASDSESAPAPSLEEDAPPATRGNTKNLQFGGAQLRAQTAAVGPKVQRCVDEAVKKGHRPNGTAMLTYIVAQHGDKYEVENTGIDEDKTTLQGGSTELLDCMRTTAFAMHFEGLPREATGIVASRSVTLKDGVIVEYKHVEFSYLR
jgi:hypothetical protein